MNSASASQPMTTQKLEPTKEPDEITKATTPTMTTEEPDKTAVATPDFDESSIETSQPTTTEEPDETSAQASAATPEPCTGNVPSCIFVVSVSK